MYVTEIRLYTHRIYTKKMQGMNLQYTADMDAGNGPKVQKI